MEKHVTALGALFIAVGAIGLIGMLVVFVIFSLGSVIIGTAAAQDPQVPRFVAMLPLGFGTLIALIIMTGALPALIAGFGLLGRRPWARTWSFVAAVLNLAVIPIGTGVSIYALWVLLQEGTLQVLREEPG